MPKKHVAKVHEVKRTIRDKRALFDQIPNLANYYEPRFILKLKIHRI